MAEKRVVCIRPGETDWNKLGRWQGHIAVPLNAHGKAQAERLAQFIRNIGLDAIYSSDLRRARDTAEIVAAKSGLHVRYDARLRERHMGEWQGLTLSDIDDWYHDEYRRVKSDPHNFQVPGGESRRQVADRVRRAFDDIIARGGDTIGLISHTTALRTLLADVLPESNAYDMHFRNMSVTTLIYRDGNWQITQFDDVTHLEGMPSESFTGVEESSYDSSN